MSIHQYLVIARRWLWLVLLSTCIAAGISYYTSIHQPYLYTTSAKLLVGRGIQNLNPSSGDLATSEQLALTYIQIAKTTPVLQRTLDSVGLDMNPGDFARFTNASIIPGTQIIELSVVDSDPVRAQMLANELAHQLTLEGPATSEQERAKRNGFVQQQADELEKKIEAGQAKIAELGNASESASSAVEINDQQQQINALQSQITQWQQTYAALIAFLTPQAPNYLSILEPAALPTRPISPNVPQNILVASAIGLLLAVGGIFLLEFLDDRFKSADEVQPLLNLAVLGNIPPIPRASQRLVTSFPPRAPIAQAYRILRTNIQFAGIDHPVKSILVTSPNSHEGKSVNSSNLAIVMAQAGLRVILVDADLHGPSLHKLFELPNNVGLTDALLGTKTLASVARMTKVENLRLISTGALPPNPTEIVGSERMQNVIQELEQDADIVIFDSPPCLPLADASILAQLTDGVIIVLDMPHVRRQVAIRARVALAKGRTHIFGVLLNRINQHDLGYKYNYPYAISPRDSSAKESSLGSPKPLLERILGLVHH